MNDFFEIEHELKKLRAKGLHRIHLHRKHDQHLPIDSFQPERRRSFTTLGTRDCILPTVPKGRCGVFVIKRRRHCNGATLRPANRFAFPIRATKSSSFPFPANDSLKTNNKNMNTKFILAIAIIAFDPVAGFAQPSLPPPPAPPNPPGQPDRHEKMPKVPVTFLGVETSEVPGVVSEQLRWPCGSRRRAAKRHS